GGTVNIGCAKMNRISSYSPQAGNKWSALGAQFRAIVTYLRLNTPASSVISRSRSDRATKPNAFALAAAHDYPEYRSFLRRPGGRLFFRAAHVRASNPGESQPADGRRNCLAGDPAIPGRVVALPGPCRRWR